MHFRNIHKKIIANKAPNDCLTKEGYLNGLISYVGNILTSLLDTLDDYQEKIGLLKKKVETEAKEPHLNELLNITEQNNQNLTSIVEQGLMDLGFHSISEDSNSPHHQ